MNQLLKDIRRQWSYERRTNVSTMARGSPVIATALILMMIASTCLVAPAQADQSVLDEIEVLHTAVNPDNNKTYHLLSASSWEDAAFKARSLDGYLTTIDDAEENTWVFDTFASFDDQSRHLWIGLNDVQDEGIYRWHDGTPFLYRNWGVEQPTGSEDSDYVHIASTNMGNIMPQTWNDLENNPEYFPVYGVVEVGAGADFSLRFDGHHDHIVIAHDEGLMPNGSLSIEATIKASNLDDIRFVTMKGDYGWGLYLSEGYIGYASDYSLSKHPLSDLSIEEDVWYTIGVSIIEGVGGEFTINGTNAGNISAEDANIPVGDFGSNDCYTSGDACDELYIARMGAGCDCYYFEGIIDDLTIAFEEDGNWTPASHWTFWEGEGGDTGDALNNGTLQRVGYIDGADWVLPDGSIVAQAVELPNDEFLLIEDIQAGDTLLFYADIEEYTYMTDIAIYAWSEIYYDDWDYYYEGNLLFDAYVGYDRIPAPWDYDLELTSSWGTASSSWSWPEQDVMWYSVIAKEDIDEIEIIASWEVAEAPPSFDEMTELYNGVPIPSQSVKADRYSYEAALEYYYVNVTDNLTELKIETYGGRGDVDLILSSQGPVNPNNYYYYYTEPYYYDDYYYDDWYYYDEYYYGNGIISSTGGDNDEIVNFFDVEPGTYYITAYTYEKATDFTIVADFTYAPANADPSTAIELQPGIAHGPMSGYDGLDQYFFIDVASGTERLEVDLDGGFGEATLHMRYENTPTASEADYHSAASGAGDKIGFNNPTPGKWYILLESESVFSGVSITASYEDLYVWEYDGTPIELFNNEPIDGLEAPAGEEMYFYIELESFSDFMIINTYDGEGSLYLTAEGDVYYGYYYGYDDYYYDDDMMFELDEDMIFEETYTSYGEGTEQDIYVYSAVPGRFEITIYAVEDFSDVSIVAEWNEYDIPGEPEPEPEPEPEDIYTCDYWVEEIIEGYDVNGDGLFNADEFRRSNPPDDTTFSDVDVNEDGMIEYAEILADVCACDMELELLADQLPYTTSVEFFESLSLKNKYDMEMLDADEDGFISMDELEEAAETCETTFNPFDSDGDGVPDIDDQFPDDPDESKDADGDGIGDNADFAPSVANDVVYGAGGAMLIVLIGLLILFVRGAGGSRQQLMDEEWNKTDAFAEQMMQMNNQYDAPASTPEAPSLGLPGMAATPAPIETGIPIYDFGQMNTEQAPMMEQPSLMEQPVVDAPSTSLMGMMDANGREHIEYPANSGRLWHRDQPDAPWIKS
ncbi:MAG: pre-peptidase C-terminal domain-containing protein [Candidatus Poseidoniaceae archaeon]